MAPRNEKRGTARFEIHCPVTVRVRAPGQARLARELGQGILRDIGEKGARFQFNRPLEVKERICLDVHIHSDPDDRATTMRFWGIVERAQRQFPYEIAVRFVSRGLFLRSKLKRLNKVSQSVKRYESGEWIN
jgi:PilZ domain